MSKAQRHEPPRTSGGSNRASPDPLALSALAFDATNPEIERVLDAVLDFLEMDAAFVSEFARGEEVYRIVAGDAHTFGLDRHSGLPIGHSYSQRLLEGRIPNLVPETAGEGEVRDLYVTNAGGIRAYIGAPLVFSSGRIYGAVGCFSHTAQNSLAERDIRYIQMVARLIADQIERRELELRNWKLREEAVAVRALLVALEARDGYTGEHSKAVVELSMAVARHLGMEEAEVTLVEQLALLHDIGKLGVSDAILCKPRGLDNGEWTRMKEHPVIGERIVSSLYGLEHLAPFIRAEHERWDGRGYPDGLAGDTIPATSRIVLVCDAYHAMVSDRPYRKALTPHRAIEELESHAATQFCPRSVHALLAVLRRMELGETLDSALVFNP